MNKTRKPQNWPPEVRKYEAAYVKFGFTARNIINVSADDSIQYSKLMQQLPNRKTIVRKKNIIKVEVSLHVFAALSAALRRGSPSEANANANEKLEKPQNSQ